MKNLKSLVLGFALVVLTSNIYSQASCSSHIIKYNGPQNTQKLKQYLETSTVDVIVNLSQEMKDMLVEVSVFKGGRFVGFDSESTNPNIKLFYASNAKAVFSAIFQTDVDIVSSNNLPIVKTISVQEFKDLTQGGLVFKSIITICNNCRGLDGGLGQPGTYCCQVGGNGCADYVVPIGGDIYVIDNQQ